MLKPQDVLILLRLAGDIAPWNFQKLSIELGLSASEVHQGLKRAEASNLYDPLRRLVLKVGLQEFAVYGLRYVYPAKRLPRCNGIPTAHSAAPLRQVIVSDQDDILVWPHPDGDLYGDAIEPLYRSAPFAAQTNPALHRRLALVDALRLGRVRERSIAAELLREEMGG